MIRALVVHPGTQHAFRLVDELARREALAGFCTGFAIGRGGAWEAAIDLPLSPFRETLANRRTRDVPSKLLRLQIGMELATRVRGLVSPNGERLMHWRNARFQRAVPEQCLREADVVIGFDTSSWLLAERCRELGRPFVMVQTIGHPVEKERVFERLRRLYPDWSVTAPKKSAEHIELERKEHLLADLIVAPSGYVRQTLISQGVPASKVCCVPFGSNLELFKPEATKRTDGRVVFLFVGHISARKGIPVLLEAWREMQNSAAELWLVGAGAIPKSQAVGLPSSVKLLGERSHADVAKLMKLSDVFVFPSFFEGLAKVQVEALLSGLPVISTHEAGAADIIEDGCNGFIVPAGDSVLLAQRMMQLVDDRELLNRIRSAVNADRAKLGWSVFGDRWIEVLKRAVVPPPHCELGIDGLNSVSKYSGPRRLQVLIAHPGTQYSYQLARELERHGRLLALHTSLAMRANCVVGGIKEKLPAGIGNRLVNRIVDLPARKLRVHPVCEISRMFEELLGSGKGEAPLHRRNDRFQRSIPDAHLNQSDFVVGFDTSSWLIAGRTKRLGGLFILDQSIGHPIAKERAFSELRDRYPLWRVTVPVKDEAHILEEQEEHALADRIVAPSRFVRDTLVANGIPSTKVRIIPFGTDLSVFHPDDRPREFGKCLFLFVGSISARKGVPVLLDAWRKLQATDAELWLVGPGKLPPGEVDRLPASVRLLGPQSRADVAKLMRRADVFVFPSFFEGLAQVQVEALASGLPLISTREAGAEDLIVDDHNGFLVPSGDVAALATRMQQLVKDRDLLAAMRSRAIAEREQLSWTIYGDRWVKVLDELS